MSDYQDFGNYCLHGKITCQNSVAWLSCLIICTGNNLLTILLKYLGDCSVIVSVSLTYMHDGKIKVCYFVKSSYFSPCQQTCLKKLLEITDYGI